jgi:hypothetical protein
MYILSLVSEDAEQAFHLRYDIWLWNHPFFVFVFEGTISWHSMCVWVCVCVCVGGGGGPAAI